MAELKRRYFTRYEINLSATLIIDNTPSIPCVIRDFCSAGMFIELQKGQVLNESYLQKRVCITFLIKSNQQAKNFTLSVSIVHLNSIGLGVSYEENYDTAFDMLLNESQKIIGSGHIEQQTNPENLAKLKKLEADVSFLSKKVLSTVITSFYQRTEKKIQQESENIENYQYRAALLDTRSNLKVNKQTLCDSFQYLNNKIPLLTCSLPQLQENELPDKSALSLVDKSEFEDWLNLASIIRNLETLFESKLNSLQYKTAFILKMDKKKVINPFSPKKLCDRFREALTKIEEGDQGKNWLYSIFGETLAEVLPLAYEKMDDILVVHGAQESNSGFIERRKSSQKAVSSTGDAQTEKTLDHEVPLKKHASLKQGDQKTPVESLYAESQQTLDYESAVSLSAQAQEVSQVSNVVSNLLHLVQRQQQSPQEVTVNSDAVNAYSEKDIYSALARLQQNVVNDHSPNINHQNLQNKLHQTLTDSSTSQKFLSSRDKSNLDVYDSLFQTLFNDELLTKESQGYLQRIYMPIMAQSIHNPQLLESSDSALNIINHLSKLEAAVKDNKTVKNSRIKNTLDQLIKQISLESLSNPAIFDSVEKKLDILSQSVDKSVQQNITRVYDAYEGKQKLKQAQLFVQNELNTLFGNKKTPKIIITLLEAGWQHLLVITKLNSDTRAYKNHLRVINNLNVWLIRSEKMSEELAKMLLEVIDRDLQPICTDTLLYSKIQHELNDLLVGDNPQPESLEMLMINFNEHSDEQQDNKRGETGYLIVGEWLTFLLKNEFEPLKLVWINEHHTQFVFVDRAGIKKLELKSEGLAKLIKSGTAKRIESLDLPVMDRATSTMLQNLHEKLIYNATRDPITKLLNQKEFIKQIKRELDCDNESKYLLCNIEIEDFRIIINACGISGEEALLVQVSDTLKNHVGQNDIYARINDKTFSVLLKNGSANEAKKLHEQLIESEFRWQDKRYAVAISMGVVPLFSIHEYDINRVLQDVDSATLSASSAGRNRIRVYKDNDESLKSQFNAREWVGRINQVLAEKRLFLRCQKIAAIEPATSSHTHYEILLGIKDEAGKTIPPDDFIPAVERCKRMTEIDQWVVLSVFAWIEENQAVFHQLDGFSINLSGESMNSEDFLDFLTQTLSSCKVPLEKITFEITETVAADSFQFIQMFIKKIKTFKCKFSLDDFGSGYSSYSYLKSLDVDYLKIDGVFVKDLVNNETDIAIVTSMNEIAHSLKLKTIAEYVENDEIQMVLKEIGVDYVQGWGVEKPKLLTDLNSTEGQSQLCKVGG